MGMMKPKSKQKQYKFLYLFFPYYHLKTAVYILDE